MKTVFAKRFYYNDHELPRIIEAKVQRFRYLFPRKQNSCGSKKIRTLALTIFGCLWLFGEITLPIPMIQTKEYWKFPQNPCFHIEKFACECLGTEEFSHILFFNENIDIVIVCVQKGKLSPFEMLISPFHSKWKVHWPSPSRCGLAIVTGRLFDLIIMSSVEENLEREKKKRRNGDEIIIITIIIIVNVQTTLNGIKSNGSIQS